MLVVVVVVVVGGWRLAVVVRVVANVGVLVVSSLHGVVSSLVVSFASSFARSKSRMSLTKDGRIWVECVDLSLYYSKS
jgi:hypothetical protein